MQPISTCGLTGLILLSCCAASAGQTPATKTPARAGGKSKAAAQRPVLHEPLFANARELLGTLDPKAGTAAICVNYDCARFDVYVSASGKLIARLVDKAPALSAGNAVRIEQTTGRETVYSEVRVVQGPAPADKTSTAGSSTGGTDSTSQPAPNAVKLAPVTVRPLQAGAQKITGTVPSLSQKLALTISGESASMSTQGVANGVFTITLDSALKENQRVCVAQLDDRDTALAKGCATVQAKAAPVYLDGAGVVGSRELLVNFKGLPETDDALTLQAKIEGKVAGNYDLKPDDRKKTQVTLKLDKDLAAREKVTVALLQNKVKLSDNEVTVFMPAVTLNPVLKEGGKEVEGSAPAGVALVRTKVFDGDEDVKLGTEFRKDVVQQQDTKPDELGKFKVTLANPLAAGQRVASWVVVKTPGGDQEIPTEVGDVKVMPVTIDWGRARGVFGLGAVVGKNNDDFSKVDPYLSFTFDYNWLNSNTKFDLNEVDKEKCVYPGRWNDHTRLSELSPSLRQRLVAGKDPQPATDMCIKHSTFHVSVNSFFEGRLTQASGGTQDSDFGKAKKSAFFQTGVYFPMFVSGMNWTYRGHRNAFFVAPLFKYGAQTVSGGIEVSRTFKKNDKQEATELKVIRDDGVFPFHSTGMRFGVFQFERLESLDQKRQLAPELLSYLDVTFGRWTHLRNPLAETMAASGLFTRNTKVYSRVGIEGRVKVPATPLFFGFEASLDGDRQPSDFRFLFGVRTDAAKALSKAFGGQ